MKDPKTYHKLQDNVPVKDSQPNTCKEKARRQCCNSNTTCTILTLTASALGAILYWNSSEKAAQRWQRKLSLPAWTIYLPKIGGLSTNFLFILSALFTLTYLAEEPFNGYALCLAVISNISTYWIANSDALWAKNSQITTANILGTIINTAVNYVSNYHLLTGLNKRALSSEQKKRIKDLEKEQFKIRNKVQTTLTDSKNNQNRSIYLICCLSILGGGLKWLLSVIPLYWQNIGYTVSTFNAMYTWQPNNGGIISGSIFASIYLISQLGFTIKGHRFLDNFINKTKNYGIPIALKKADYPLQIVFFLTAFLAIFSGFGADDANFSCWKYWHNETTTPTNPTPSPQQVNHTFTNHTQARNTHQGNQSNPVAIWLIWLSGSMGNIGAAMGYNFLEILDFMITALQARYDATLSDENKAQLTDFKNSIKSIEKNPEGEKSFFSKISCCNKAA